MEPVKGGSLAKVPKQVESVFLNADPHASIASWAIRFAASLDHVYMVLSGMSTYGQLLDNTDYMQNFQPLTSDDCKVIEKAVTLLKSDTIIPCTAWKDARRKSPFLNILLYITWKNNVMAFLPRNCIIKISINIMAKPVTVLHAVNVCSLVLSICILLSI